MFETIKVRCPQCREEFSWRQYVGEEPREPNATLTRNVEQGINWGQFAEEIHSGYGAIIISVGDTIRFRLTDERTVTIRAVAKDLYEPNSVIFIFDSTLCNWGMNDRDTNEGGWAKCKIADRLDKEILPLLPEGLQTIIKPRTIKQQIEGQVYEKTSKLWLPSYTEVFKAYYADVDDKTFPYFNSEISRVRADKDGSTVYWWLRSPIVDYSTVFWYVNTNGNDYAGNASIAYGVCPCFSI